MGSMLDAGSSTVFTTTEAAVLAEGCLALSSGAPASKAAGKAKVLTTLVIRHGDEPSEAPVNKAIDDGIVNVIRLDDGRRTRARRMVDETAILYLLCTKLISLNLTLSAKRNLYQSLRKLRGKSAHSSPSILLDNFLSFDPGPQFLHWRNCIAHYAEAREAHVVRDPEIMGGVPTVRGTRIPVHSLAARFEGGESVADIKRDYPHVKHEALLAALAYAKANPKVGRPPAQITATVRAPWDK